MALRILFVAPPGTNASMPYLMRWRGGMRILLVSKLARSARAINTIAEYSRVATELGHQVAVFGEKQLDFPELEFSLDVHNFDFAVFAVYMASDFPDLPYLARLLDGIPKHRRVIIDCTGRYNETIRVEHDFNHLEKMDGHQGWEWIEAFQSVAGLILQPTLTPRREDVKPFLFHGYDTTNGFGPETLRQPSMEKYAIGYVGNNWQRWSQMHRFLEAIAPIRHELGEIRIAGWDWKRRPEWAVQMGIRGADVDPEFLQSLDVKTEDAIPFTEVRVYLSKAGLSLIFQRPLFNELGLATNRIFETFLADTIPLVMLPQPLAESIYSAAVRPLLPKEDIVAWIRNMIQAPEPYREAVRAVRQHLAEHHSYRQRFAELVDLLGS